MMVMTLSCLGGRHWPVAAFSAAVDGPRSSRCADCGAPMQKGANGRWTAQGRRFAWAWRRLLGGRLPLVPTRSIVAPR